MDWKEINERFVYPAKALWKSGRKEEAEALFKKGLVATNNDGYLTLNYGQFLVDCGRCDEAEAILELAVFRLPLPKYKKEALEWLDKVRQRKVEHKKASLGVQACLRRVCLISCTKSKKNYPCTAREFYSESKNFKEVLDLSEGKYDKVYIVSARYGFVDLTQILNWYDRSLNEFTPEERDAWARLIAANLRLNGITEGYLVDIFANELYCEHLSKILQSYGIKVRCFDMSERPKE